MQYIEAPYEYKGRASTVFLAGGITDAPGWQMKLTALLCPSDWVVLNPRRHEFDIEDASLFKEQIAWEQRHLARASLVSFWFPAETLCPITLFELGTVTSGGQPMIVGADPSYARRNDIEEQLSHRRPEVTVTESIEELAEQILAAYPGRGENNHHKDTQCHELVF